MNNSKKIATSIVDRIQEIYVHLINGFLFKATARFSTASKNATVSSCLMVLSIYYLLDYTGLTRYVFKTDDGKGLFVLFFVVLIIMFSINDRISKVSFNAPIMCIYYLFIISIFTARVFHPLRGGRVVFAVTLLVFPAFYIIWENRKEYEWLFCRTAYIWMITSLLFYIASFICLPPDSWHFYMGRYTGLATTPNRIGLVSTCLIAASLYMLMQEKHTVMAILSTGVGFTEVWISGSRTAFLADVVIAVVYTIVILRKKDIFFKKDQIKPLLGLGIAICVGMAGARMAEVPAVNFGYNGISTMRELTDSGDKYTDEEIVEYGIDTPENNNNSFLNNIGLYVYAEEAEDSNAQENEPYKEHQGSTIAERMTGYNEQEDFSNGRLEIYKQVIDSVNLIGHDMKEEPLYYTNAVNGKTRIMGAHNTPLDFTYTCGIISGLLCLMLELMAAYYVLGFLFSKKTERLGAAYAVMVIAGFGVHSFLDIQVVMGNKSLVFLFFLVFSMTASYTKVSD